MARVRVPEGSFELAVQVRSYEAGREGYVRPANILRYLEYLATEDSANRGFDHTWYERNGSAWVVREMRLRLGELPGIGEHLRMATWVSDYGRVQAHREYVLWHEATGRLIARAQGRWGYIDRTTLRPTRIPEELSARILSRGVAMPSWTLPPSDSEATRDAVTFVAREYQVDSQQHVNNAVYMDWIEDKTHGTLDDLREQATRLRRIHLEYLRPGLPGEHIHVSTRMRRLGRRGLSADYEMAAGREWSPVLRARALYAFAGASRAG